MSKYFIGISALHHDSAVALIDDIGNILYVSQEERRTLIKNDSSWPEQSLNLIHRQLSKKIPHSSKDNVKYGYYEKPWLKFLRRIKQNPKGVVRYFNEAKIPGNKLSKINTISHHKAHALAGCATSPFDECIYLTVDAIGEFNSTTWGTFSSKDGINQEGSINYPHSLGLLYSAFTRWLGFKPNEEEYIVMGAAAYGSPIYENYFWDNLIELTPNGYKMKRNLHRGVEQILGELNVADWFSWAASLQSVTEKTLIHLVELLNKKYGNYNLVFGGGVALNCVANSKILRSGLMNNLWIIPSPGDSGNALGAAAHIAGLNKLIWNDVFLGNSIDDKCPPPELIHEVSRRLDRGEIIGWIQGKEEFGPRALGGRSLLADPRNPTIKDKVNKIKHRQEFRPFAPVVLEENAYQYFDMPGKPENHRYMQYVSRVRNPDSLPAISHVDNTARVQTVPNNKNHPFRLLLEDWYKYTDCAVLLNTSLNIRGKPLMSDRKEAIRMLLENPMDALIIGNRLYYKTQKFGLSEDDHDPVDVVEYKEF